MSTQNNLFMHYYLLIVLFIFKDSLLIMLLKLSHFSSPLYLPLPNTLIPSSIPPLSSCPWIVHTSPLASPFPILSLTFLCLLAPTNYVSYSQYLFLLPTDNPPCDLHFCDSVPVLVVCLVCFSFFRFGC